MVAQRQPLMQFDCLGSNLVGFSEEDVNWFGKCEGELPTLGLTVRFEEELFGVHVRTDARVFGSREEREGLLDVRSLAKELW